MSLNWKEINLVLSELDLVGAQIQKAIQSNFNTIALKIYGKGETKNILVSLTPGACRLHETFKSVPKNEKPLRFAEFLNSKIVNGWIEEAVQLEDNRIVRFIVRLGVHRYKIYIRLWSNASNFIVTDEKNIVLDAMRRLPKRGEITGAYYLPEESLSMEKIEKKETKEYAIREFSGEKSFNENIDAWYAEHGNALSLEVLRETARKIYEGKIERLVSSLEKLRIKEKEYAQSEKFKEYGDLILANSYLIKSGDLWLETNNFYTGENVRIKLDAKKSPAMQAESYYEQYRKAKNGLLDVQNEILSGENECLRLENTLNTLLSETNPLVLHKLLKIGGVKAQTGSLRIDKKRPGLAFLRNNWLIIVGRDANENDVLLRKYVKGNDVWLHARDFSGSYVFIKQRSGKSVPLDILLDAGNLAIFYSKGRNNGEGDLFYTYVKYLRRAKDGPKGLVIPTQEKNLHIKVDEKRLKELESARYPRQRD